ncbi:MAG TPA: aminoglycoside phosphotransferase family protein, partial [Gemmatimonadales bacterium]|nr:aminoglycoside phosphotransferase family protein [Gemmatimonadales bacterium]
MARFLARALRQRGQVDTSRECLTHVPTTGGADWLVDDDGRCWRLFLFVPGTRSLERPASAHEAREAARAYGAFLQLLTEYDGPPLHRTLHRFHDTAWRFECLEQAASADPCGRLASCRLEVGALLEAADLARALSLHPGPGVPERIVHNDARLANLLFDERAARALCVVDLDTVMPGTALYDFGDLVRSAATTAPEDAEDPGQVEANEELFEALVQGYLETAGTVLTQSERALLATAGRILTLEQAA